VTLVQRIGPAAHLSMIDGHDAVVLSAGELEATFVPELGMIGASLRHAGDELLHPGDGLRSYRNDGSLLGLPLLHPWANRLSADEYVLHGRPVSLPTGRPVLRDDQGLPIHGLAAAHPGWVVDSIDAGAPAARLQATLDFAAHPELLAGFPFPHTLTIVATLTPRALQVATTITPTGGVPVPVAFGYHPYLTLPGVDRSQWELCFPRRRHLELDGRGIPTGRGRRTASTRFALGARSFDDGFDGVDEGAAFTLAGGARKIRVCHDWGYPVAQVYSPPGAQFICLEPMTAPVNALRSGAGLCRATPGRPFTAVFSIAVEER
jgi:aldose 1-epimerase